MSREARPCICCGRPTRWESAECYDCRGVFSLERDEEPPPGRRRGTSKIDVVRAAKLLYEGKTYLQVALDLDVSPSGVILALRRAGLARTPRRGAKKGQGRRFDWRQIVKLNDGERSTREIASLVGCSQSVVTRVLREAPNAA